MAKETKSNVKPAALLLRAGLILVFAYAAVSSLQHPLVWVGFLPNFLTRLVPLSAMTLLKLFAVYELLLVAWLLSGKFVKYGALLCSATLLAIVAINTNQLITTFRDVGLACMGIALYFLSE
jgi:hypothetical protein